MAHLRLSDRADLPAMAECPTYAAIDTERRPRLGEYVAVRDGPAQRIGLLTGSCGPDCCVVAVCGGPRLEVGRDAVVGTVLSITQVVAAL